MYCTVMMYVCMMYYDVCILMLFWLTLCITVVVKSTIFGITVIFVLKIHYIEGKCDRI